VSALYPIIAVIITAFGAVWLQNKRLSGKIDTSEAASLWQEAASQREDYRERLSSQNDRITKLEERIARAEERNTKLAEQNIELRQELAEAEVALHECQDKLAAVERENESLRNTIRRHLDES
jgi:septal ring factor EnvC (AmiA/AmiB activator)